MRALVGGIPRAFKSHKTPEGAAYGEYVRAILARSPLPKDAMPTLREAGRLTIELAAMGFELAEARARKRRRDVARLRRQMVPMRTQLIRLEERLEQLSTRQNGHGDGLAGVAAAVEAANRR